MNPLSTLVRTLEEVAAAISEEPAAGPRPAAGARDELLIKLHKALGEIRILSGVLHICAACKRIQDDDGSWTQCELYIRDHSEAEFSHGLCPSCAADALTEVARTAS